MKILEHLKDNTLIICPNAYKRQILLELNKTKKILDISFMSFEEYKKNYFFDVDISGILYLVNNHKLSVRNAKEIIANLIYVSEDKTYNNEKLDLLVKYKKELIDNNLLIYNKLFPLYLNNKNILVCGYGTLDSFDASIIKGRSVTFINDDLIDKEYYIHEFSSMEKEIAWLYESIFDLLKKGVDINKIFILNASKDYKTYFERYNTYFDFKIETSEKFVLGTNLANEFIAKLANSDKQDIYNYLSKYNNPLSSKLIDLLNKYAAYELKDVKDLIIDDLKNLKIKDNYTNIVKCIHDDSLINDDEYVFLVGFNDTYPNVKKDIEYITDNMKPLLKLPLIEEENKLIKDNTIKYLSNINNLTLSYCKSSPFDVYNKQTLFDNAEYINDEESYNYSNSLNELKYAYLLDDLSKYNYVHPDLDKLYSTYDSKYNMFDNKYQSFNPSLDKVTLSYSTMDDYYKCAFMYYLKSILGINEFKGTYYTNAGSICHDVLKDYISNSDFDFEKSWDLSKQKQEEKIKEELFKDEKEKFFENKIKDELKKDLEIISIQNNASSLNKTGCEQKYEVSLNDKLSFKGFIDKVMYKQDDENNYVAVVDYKTGDSASIDLKLMPYGLSLQLPSYLYLLSNDKTLKNPKFIGFYLQHLINTKLTYDKDKNNDEIKKETMCLNGYTSSDLNRADLLDKNISLLGKSETINGYKLKKDGTLDSRSKALSDEQFDSLISIVEEKVKLAGKNILEGNFKINPKVIDGKNVSCQYCKLKDICFKRFKDYEYIKSDGEDE